ncbi:MAG TPA: hypothetical protein PKK39_07905 [Tepidiformaceae bacterium]|nr:hypothetical protein [Tepidiformaceae bacterium]
MRTASRWLLPAALALGALFGACSDKADSDRSPSPDTGRVMVEAPVESIEVLVRESAPPGYTAHVVSGLPSGCAQFAMAAVMERTGNHIVIRVTNTVPSDPKTICTTIYGFHESNVDLGTNFRSGETYTVEANGKSTTFKAQ